MKLEHRDTPVGRAEGDHDPVAAFKRRASVYAARATEEFDIPGYDDLGGLVAVYKRLDPDDARRVLMLGEGTTTQKCAQFLLDSCIGVYRGSDEGLKPMWPAGQAIKPSEAPLLGDFNTIFDLELDDARDVVVAVFGGVPAQVEEHSDDVYKWMTAAQAAKDADDVKG